MFDVTCGEKDSPSATQKLQQLNQIGFERDFRARGAEPSRGRWGGGGTHGAGAAQRRQPIWGMLGVPGRPPQPRWWARGHSPGCLRGAWCSFRTPGQTAPHAVGGQILPKVKQMGVFCLKHFRFLSVVTAVILSRDLRCAPRQRAKVSVLQDLIMQAEIKNGVF